jgi:hypothetical protein
MDNKLNIKTKELNIIGIIFLIFLNYYFCLNNFTSSVPGKYLLLICLFINLIFSWQFNFLEKRSLFFYFFISITITNFLFNETYLLSFNTFEPYHLLNVLSITSIVPMFLKNIIFKNFYISNILFAILIFENLAFLVNKSHVFNDNGEIYIFFVFIFIGQKFKNNHFHFLIPFLLLSIFLDIFIGIFALFYFLIKDEISKFNHLSILLVFFVIYILNYSKEVIDSLKLNIDNYVFFFTGVRSNILREPVYFATLDNKGFFLFEIYKVLSKLATFVGIEQWNYIFLGLSLFLIIFIFIFNKISTIFQNSILIKFTLILLVVNDVLFDVDKTVRFGSRLIGSLLILTALFFIINKKLYIGSIFLLLSNFVLISFVIPVALIVLFLILKDNKNVVVIKYLFINLAVIIFYLLATNQFDYYYITQVKFLTSAASQSFNLNLFFMTVMIHILPFSLILLTFKNQNLNEKEKFITNIFYIWLFGEILHLLLTSARFSHYKNLLIIPSIFVISLTLKNINEVKFHRIKIVILLIIIFNFGSNDIQKNYQAFFNEGVVSEDKKVKTNEEKDYEYGIYLTFTADDYKYYFDNYKIIPSTKAWVLVATDNDIRNWVSSRKILEYFFQDYNEENPKYLIVNNETYKDLNNLQLFSKLKKEYKLIECHQETCLYDKLN